jgi:predicted amidohydrolase YtcJ
MKHLAYCLIYSALGVLHAGAGDCDLVVIGQIRTVSKAMPLAEGMAVKDGRIAYIGAAGEARNRLSPAGTLIELAPGQSVLPGIVDAHIHMLDAGMKRRSCMMEEPSSREQVLQTVADFAKKNPDFEWITGYGWPPSLFPDGNPHKKDLDAIVPDRPVFLFADDGHSAWLNSKGLATLGITKESADPPLGRIERDPQTGEPTGVLREEAAFQAEDRLPQPTDEFMLDSLKEVQKYLHGLGITMIQDAYTSPRFLEIYSRAARSGDLTMKVVAAHVTNPAPPASQVDALIELRDKYAYGHLRADSAKILMDGIIEAKTAAVIEPYVDTNDHGILNWQAAEFAAMAQRLDKEGFQIHIHAVGDRAVRAGLDGLEAARKANGLSNNRHQMAHLEMVDPDDIPRFQELEVTANFQPYWLYEDVWLEKNTVPYIGPERAKRLYQIKTLTDGGARLALGSDWPISAADPFLGMMVAATHKNPKKPEYPVWEPEERMPMETLLEAYTLGGAWINRSDEDTGSLEQNKAADFIIIDRDILAIPPDKVGGTQVLSTYVDGKCVYQRPPDAAAKPAFSSAGSRGFSAHAANNR